jgi:hypothetical protein
MTMTTWADTVASAQTTAYRIVIIIVRMIAPEKGCNDLHDR